MNYLRTLVFLFLIGILLISLNPTNDRLVTLTTLGEEYFDGKVINNKSLKRVNYSQTLSEISMMSTVPTGYTLVSSNTEYLYDDLGTSIQNLDFSNLAVKFGTCNLGSKSYVTVTSVADGLSQTLNTQTMSEWKNISAFLNGHYAKIEVFRHNSESGISCSVERLITTEISSPEPAPCNTGSGCGNTATDDLDRVSSNHQAVTHRFGGTISMSSGYMGLTTGGVGGTASLTSNGAFVTAGHVVSNSGDFQQIHFNPPSSTVDGATKVPSPDDQYAIDFSSITTDNTTSSSGDWSVFKVFPNPNTGLLPGEVQSSFLRVGIDNIPTSGFKYGHGVDVFPTGTCGSLNSSSRTQQRATASNITYISTSTGSFDWYGVNEGGDSGSSIVTTINSVEVSMGVNTTCSGGSIDKNSGTSFKNTAFANAINNIYGTSHNYIDGQHPSSSNLGSMIRPYKTIVDGVSGATNYETLSIAKGSYNETMTITKPLKLVAPVGKVTIGSSSSKAVPSLDLVEKGDSETEEPTQVQLFQNYPNPFNPTTSINYSVPEQTNVSLTVYNNIGQLVVELVNEVQSEGSYTVQFNADNLSSGTYFYVLRTNNSELIKQMTLIK